ncbi:uncharacterized protein LOC134805542 [Cydia splendana]|uniref:uncharacterized protein LOC134805542 n=1 Tax=Cydia splendana TaxID=1100963 RepID=UPI00300C41E2
MIHNKWLDVLPTVLLGLRAATRSDTGVSAAQLMYGCSIRLPGDFFDVSNTATDQAMDYGYVDNLRRTISQYKAAEYSRKNTNVFVHKDLRTCQNVFLRIDTGHKALKPPYEGPYPVLSRDGKVFKLQLPGRQVNVSIDRLKPAFVINDDLSEGADPEPKTSRSRRIRKPVVRFA